MLKEHEKKINLSHRLIDSIFIALFWAAAFVFRFHYLPNAQANLEALFLKLTPKADDLWFKAMALRNNIHPKLSEIPVKEPIPILGTQAISLKKENVDQDKNLQQWKDLEDYFQLALDK